jgi:hypothetical protein
MSTDNNKYYSVKNLYNKLNAYEVSQLETIEQIKNMFYVYVQNVFYGKKSHIETINFDKFKPKKTLIKDEIKDFNNLDLNSSMIASLWYCIYH